MKEEIATIATKIREGGNNVAFTGAGISTESGIPDFRSQGGIWERFRPVYFDEFMSSKESRIEYWRRWGELYRGIVRARPNPAHSQVGFSFSLPTDAYARVRFYDSAGRLIRTLVDAPLSAGTYSASWDGRDDAGRAVAPGVYFYELRTNGERLSRQVSWMR